MGNKKDALVITNPMIAANRSAEVTLSKFLRVIAPSVHSVKVIGGNLSLEKDLKAIELVSFPIVRKKSKLKRALAVASVQMKMAGAVLRQGKKGESVFFWIADKMILPYLAAKFKRLEIHYFIYGNVEKEGASRRFTKLSGKLIRYMATHADYTCMESPSVIHEWPGLKPKRVEIIHLYTDVIQNPKFEDRKCVFGMVCRLTPGKHVIECIQAMSQVHLQHPDWRMEIIGSGKQERECLELIERLEAKDYVQLLGWVEHEEIVKKTKSWKYFLFPTDTEGMPNGLIEMMGCGIPAIASPVGGVRDVVQDDENGMVLQECSADAIAGKMEKAIELPEISYQRMASNAYKTIRNSFTLTAAQSAGSKYR